METVGTKEQANLRPRFGLSERKDQFHEFTLQASMRLISFSPGYGRGMFRSTDSGQNWQQINNGLLAIYESALAINTNGFNFVGLLAYRLLVMNIG